MTASSDLFTWLRGLLEPVLCVTSAEKQSATYSRRNVEVLERLWPLAADVIRRLESHDHCAICCSSDVRHLDDCPVGIFRAAVEKERVLQL